MPYHILSAMLFIVAGIVMTVAGSHYIATGMMFICAGCLQWLLAHESDEEN